MQRPRVRAADGSGELAVPAYESARATGKSAVSRRFVTMTETAVADLLAADLSRLNLVAVMVDGVHVAESCCALALGIDIAGTKHPLATVEGSTENATLITDAVRRAGSAWPGRDPAGADGAGRVHGTAPGRT